ncbi:uncharacterized protein [Henckelia pumila]|uniref:uncharacterized protein n=1 Tax=Henckelia pumila TaxID=405737 RepID=UPI003C6E96C8
MEVWNKLEGLYLKKSLANRLYLKKSLYSIHMEDVKDLRKHVDDFNKIILELKNIEIKIEEEDQVILLLSSLPKPYEHFVDTMLYGKQTLTMDEVKSSLMSKELQRKHVLKEESSGEGLMNIGRSSRDFKGKTKETGDVSVASDGYESSNVLLDAITESNKNWIMDSGFSFHMSPHRNWFHDFKEVEGGSVLLGNNKACKIMGVGNIKLKLDDGCERLFSSVRLAHVSERGLQELNKQGLLFNDFIGKLGFCEECVLEKSTRVKFKPSNMKSKSSWIIFIQICGGLQEYNLEEDQGCGALNQEVKCMIRKDVVFNEEGFPYKKEEKLIETSEATARNQDDVTKDQRDYQLTRDRPRRTIKAHVRLGYEDLLVYAFVAASDLDEVEPLDFEQTMNSREISKWLQAMKEEMNSLKENRTWSLIDKPKNQKLIGCEWIFNKKEGIFGFEGIRYKERLVAKGFTQREWVDFNEIFYHVVK